MITNTSNDNSGVDFGLLRRLHSTEMVTCAHHNELVEAEKAAKNGKWICESCQRDEKGERKC